MELNDTTDVKVQETIEQMETPAEDIQDGNSKNTTERDSTLVREQLASQAEEQVTERQPFLTEGEETTVPYSSGNCEEDNASLPACSCGNCSSTEETNAEIEEMEGVTKNLRNSNIELSDRVRTLQGQVKELERLFQKDTPQQAEEATITHGTIELHEDMDHMDTKEDDLEGVEETLDHSGDERDKEEENLENSEEYCIQETGTNDNIDEGPRDSMDDHEAEYQIGGDEAERRELLTEGFRILKIMYRRYK